MEMTITIDGKSYPCRQTMGGALRFKEMTGKEVSEIDPRSVSEAFTFLWCCTESACRRDGVEFGMTLMDMADSVTPEVVTGWVEAMATPDGEKKRTEASH